MIYFFFNDTATTEIYTLSLHDALPISVESQTLHGVDSLLSIVQMPAGIPVGTLAIGKSVAINADRKSTRLNSSHANISYAVFCFKKINTVLLRLLSIGRHRRCRCNVS